MTIKICAKCSDMFSATLFNNSGKWMKEYNGYVPKWFPGDHYGDYVQLDIDVETGKIVNWRKPSPSDLEKTFPEKKTSL